MQNPKKQKTKPKIVKIALSGKMGSGKTTFANWAMKERKTEYAGYKILKFARGVYEIANQYYGMPKNVKDRDLLVAIGEGMRAIKDHNGVAGACFVNKLLDDVKKAEGCNIIVDDLRFPNEAEALKKEGFKLIRLEVPEDVRVERLKKTYPKDWKKHLAKADNSTETSLDDYDGFDEIWQSSNVLLNGKPVFERVFL
jgi:dephospho-CoA kinase